MGKNILLFVLVLGLQSLLLCNPIDSTPTTIFSELVFDNNNNWTMELYFPHGNETFADSIILNVSGKEAKLKTSFNNTSVGIITSDSLYTPLTINREGDKIVIYTYTLGRTKQDSIMFGNYPGATVGTPDSGYSILRLYTYLERDCLTKNPSLGVVNDTVGLTGTLKGHIYDNNNRLIKNYYIDSFRSNSLFLEGLVSISSDGTYTTPIFNTVYKPGFLVDAVNDMGYYYDTLKIENFVLTNIHPDTVVYQDIHLTDTCEYCMLVDAVTKNDQPLNNELTLINYPNPFNPSTNFSIKIPDMMKVKQGSINIYNVRGQLIRTIPVSGSSIKSWDGKNMNGRMMSSGIYYYQLVINRQVMKNGSMILLK
ncbi:MAG: T9SS type A sorting domain-containing protein [Ignavibacteriaceae bacterium]|nr:T9SS type A sorting domain-containing protein [Ignavibacteriaceae bacterium]